MIVADPLHQMSTDRTHGATTSSSQNLIGPATSPPRGVTRRSEIEAPVSDEVPGPLVDFGELRTPAGLAMTLRGMSCRRSLPSKLRKRGRKEQVLAADLRPSTFKLSRERSRYIGMKSEVLPHARANGATREAGQ